MLAKRVIPTMLCRGRTLVKGKSFAGDRSVGHVLQAARVHARRGVDELLILDIGATAEGRGPDLDMVRELSADCFIPITVGGGVRTLGDIDALLRAGADKVAICTGADEVSSLVNGAYVRFGAQAIVGVVDYGPSGVVTRCGTNVVHTGAANDYARWLEHLGAGEILIQAIDRDGTLVGYDLDLICSVAEAVAVPVIASGGCSGPADMLAAIQAGADAVAAGALFQFTDETPKSCATYLKENGVCVRL